MVADTFSEYLRDGDVVLLCSDGLSSYVAEGDIGEILGDAVTLADAAKALVERATTARAARTTSPWCSRASGWSAWATAAQPPRCRWSGRRAGRGPVLDG